MKHFALAIGGAVLLSAATLSAQDPKKVDTGKQLFASKQCPMCHQVAGKGNKMSVLDGVASKVSAADMRKWLTDPVSMEAKLDHKPPIKMSSKKPNLKEPEIDALIAYLQTLK